LRSSLPPGGPRRLGPPSPPEKTDSRRAFLRVLRMKCYPPFPFPEQRRCGKEGTEDQEDFSSSRRFLSLPWDDTKFFRYNRRLFLPNGSVFQPFLKTPNTPRHCSSYECFSCRLRRTLMPHFFFFFFQRPCWTSPPLWRTFPFLRVSTPLTLIVCFS